MLRDPVRVALDLVIEIASPSSRRTDEIVKRKLHERGGVREYWVVDPELDVVKVHRHVGGEVRAGERTVSRRGPPANNGPAARLGCVAGRSVPPTIKRDSGYREGKRSATQMSPRGSRQPK